MKTDLQTFQCENADATYALGIKIGEKLTDRTVILKGEMGAGKTLLTKGMVKGLGLADDVTSPTYALVNVYDMGKRRVYHFDLYRLSDPDELYEIGFEDYLKDDAVAIIEWPEAVEPYLETTPVCIDIKKTGFESRQITLKGLNL